MQLSQYKVEGTLTQGIQILAFYQNFETPGKTFFNIHYMRTRARRSTSWNQHQKGYPPIILHINHTTLEKHRKRLPPDHFPYKNTGNTTWSKQTYRKTGRPSATTTSNKTGEGTCMYTAKQKCVHTTRRPPRGTTRIDPRGLGTLEWRQVNTHTRETG